MNSTPCEWACQSEFPKQQKIFAASWYDYRNVLRETPIQRLRRRIRERMEADRDAPVRRWTQAGLAKRLRMAESSVSEMLSAKEPEQGVLANLDQIAAYLEVPVTWLLQATETDLWEVSPAEQRLLKQFRQLVPDIKAMVLSFFDYTVGLLPEDFDQRQFWMKYRRLKPPDRALVEDTMDETFRRYRKRETE